MVDKFSEAICAFANDLPGSHKNGYLIIGAEDDGTIKPGFKVTDALLKNIASLRSDGNILPIPSMNVDRFEFPEGDLLVCEVQPSPMTPIRYRGRVFVRIGPRRDIASEDEERILTERRTANMATFDVTPCLRAKLRDLNIDMVRNGYLPQAGCGCACPGSSQPGRTDGIRRSLRHGESLPDQRSCHTLWHPPQDIHTGCLRSVR